MARSGASLADKLHKAFVIACMATTLAGFSFLGVKSVNFFLNVYPQIKENKRKEEEKLLVEGKSKDVLADTAPTLIN